MRASGIRLVVTCGVVGFVGVFNHRMGFVEVFNHRSCHIQIMRATPIRHSFDGNAGTKLGEGVFNIVDVNTRMTFTQLQTHPYDGQVDDRIRVWVGEVRWE